MIVKATSLSKKVDLRDRCGNLQLRPQTDDEAAVLSALYCTLRIGGTLTIKLKGKKAIRMEFK